MSELRGFWKDQKLVQERKKVERRRIKKARKKKVQRDAVLIRNGAQPEGKRHPDYKKDDRFYVSEAWRRLRYLALRNSEGKCCCCGASAADGAKLHVDHVVPRFQDPKRALDITNLQVLCEDCNLGKGAWDSTDWRTHMRSIKGE